MNIIAPYIPAELRRCVMYSLFGLILLANNKQFYKLWWSYFMHTNQPIQTHTELQYHTHTQSYIQYHTLIVRLCRGVGRGVLVVLEHPFTLTSYMQGCTRKV